MQKERRIQHYKSSQTILLVGEGDFSFSACLAKAFRSAPNMVATSLNSLEALQRKYGSFEGHCLELEKRGCLMLHEIDVHGMNKHPTLANMTFDVIVFNFPHAGHASWLCETDDILIERHKNLVRGFFRSGREMLKKGGEIHVSHRDDEPYCRWELEKLAQKEGLALKEKVPFVNKDYPGYHNKRGSFIKGNKTFPIDLKPFTFKFCVDNNRNHHINIDTAISTLSVKEQSLLRNAKRLINDDGQEIIPATFSEHRILVGDDDRSEDDSSGKKIAVGVDVGNDNDEREKGILAFFRECARLLGLVDDNSNKLHFHFD